MINLHKFKYPAPLFLIYLCCIVSCTQTQKKISPAVSQEDSSVQKTNNQHIDTPLVQGIDVSHFQGPVDWKEIDHIAFAICKATQGISFTDPNFSSNWNDLKAQKIMRGAYHFYVNTDDPVHQAQNFLNAVRDYSKGDLPLIIDIENGSLRQGDTNSDQLVNNVLQMLQFIEAKTQITPMIYTNTTFAQNYLSDDRLAVYPLWIADYKTQRIPTVPKPWSPNSWSFWQKSDTYDLDPENNKVDMDLFNGSLEKLQALTKQ
jgi:lysozyme